MIDSSESETPKPTEQPKERYEVVSVRFRSGGKSYYFLPNGVATSLGSDVIVETANGIELEYDLMGHKE